MGGRGIVIMMISWSRSVNMGRITIKEAIWICNFLSDCGLHVIFAAAVSFFEMNENGSSHTSSQSK